MRLKSIHPFATGAPVVGPKNFLFLSSTLCNGSCELLCVHRKLLAAAQGMTEEGYVYFADVAQKEMEDDRFGVRHLTFTENHFPSFGHLSAVVVEGDEELLGFAHRAYPQTPIYLFEPFLQLGTVMDLIAFSEFLRAAA